MSTVNHRSQKSTEPASPARPEPRAPRLSLGSRWAAQPTRPRLVTFSWGAVTPSTLHR